MDRQEFIELCQDIGRCQDAMPKRQDLTEYQIRKLASLKKGYGMSAARREYKAQEWRDVQDLIKRGLVRKTLPAPWNKAGAFVIATNERKTNQ